MAPSATTQQLLVSAVNNWNQANPNSPQIDPNDVTAIAITESGGQQYDANGNIIQNQNSNGTTDYGVMQLNSASFPQASTMTEQQNIATGVAYYGQNLQTFNGNTTLAISAYNAGAGAVKSAVNNGSGIPNPDYVNKVITAGGNVTQQNSNLLDPSSVNQVTLNPVASPLNSLNNTAANFDTNSLVPTIVITEGLDATPWFSDNALITGNPRLRQQVQPVSFQVMLHDNTDFILSNGGETGEPVEIQLNASMKEVSWSMKHLYNHTKTRTAHHITMWGMNADTIEGQCSTGVFMNQLGLTDYFSTRVISDQLKQLVMSGFILGENEGSINNSALGQNGLGGAVYQIPYNASQNFSTVMNQLAAANPYFKQYDAFRVAAQDAFMELLALFKMNGNVWFWNKLYQDNVGETRDWSQVEAWSPVLGLSSSQFNSRNNDVLTRGSILMKYRNFIFEGYFKSLQWAMDATKPYSWDFSFVFQVERTIGQQYIPK